MTRSPLRFPITPLWVLSPALERLVVTVGIVAVLVAEQLEETASDVRAAAAKTAEMVTTLAVWMRGER